MYQKSQEKNERTGIDRLIHEITRSLVGGVMIAFCMIPFFMIHDHTKASFWYSLGAFGVYLLGFAQCFNRL